MTRFLDSGDSPLDLLFFKDVPGVVIPDYLGHAWTFMGSRPFVDTHDNPITMENWEAPDGARLCRVTGPTYTNWHYRPANSKKEYSIRADTLPLTLDGITFL